MVAIDFQYELGRLGLAIANNDQTSPKLNLTAVSPRCRCFCRRS